MEELPRMKQVQGAHSLSQLPEDILWTVLGFLDLPTLYTARLVCKRFRKSAAEHFKALDCTILEELPTTDFTQFPGMMYLAVALSHQSRLEFLAHPRIAPVVTHVSLKGLQLQDGQTIAELEGVLMRLPKLRSVSVQPLWGDSRLPLIPITLEELKITDRRTRRQEPLAGVRDASPLTRYSQLTSLAIDLVDGAGTSMEALSSLRNLCSLDLRSDSSAVGLLSRFTALTSLTWGDRHFGEHGAICQDLGRLTGLSRLVLVESSLIFTTDADLTCIAQLTNLTCLVVGGGRQTTSSLSTALVPLTRLVSLQVIVWCNSGAVPMPCISRLHSLTLREITDASFLENLGRATRLTHLDLFFRCTPSGMWPAVDRLSMLRSLALSYYEYSANEPVFRLDSVLRACTVLTKLAYGIGRRLRPDTDLEACASLPGLRSLSFADTSALTPAWLPALQAMSGLTELCLLRTGICVADMTPDVIAAFDAERHQRGWPLLKLRVEEKNLRCFERLER